MRRSIVLSSIAALALATTLTACGNGGAADAKTIKVTFQEFGGDKAMPNLMANSKKEFEAANPGYTVKLEPIKADAGNYLSKLALMNRSASTAPDVMYEDSFQVQSDAAAGYLLPLDAYTSKWSDWPKFVENSKIAGKGEDGKIYGVPIGTDTRGIWFNKEIFKKAGLPEDWQPKTWEDILSAARAIKAKVPGVMPLNIYSGKPATEAATMQGFQMLYYGTPKGSLWNFETSKWKLGTQAFKDSLTFLDTIYKEGLGPTAQQSLDPNVQNAVSQQWLPQGKLAMNIDGNWIASDWQKDGSNPWPEWKTTMGVAAMPTQNGAAPGTVSMSGGWLFSAGAKSKSPDKAVEFIKIAMNQKNNLKFIQEGGNIPVRTDVADDPAFKASSYTPKLFNDVVEVTQYRPANSDYPKVSNLITVAMESVMTGQESPDVAAKKYDEAVAQTVGADKTEIAK